MVHVYSTYEAKAKFSEVIRKVRSGQRIVVSYRGEEVAEIRPVDSSSTNIEKALERLEDEGVLSRAVKSTGQLRPLAKRRGAVARFLESRK